MNENIIHKKMIAIMNALPAIGKNNQNTSQRFNFRGIDDVYNILHGLMAKNGVYSTPEVIESESHQLPSKSGGYLNYRILKIKYTFYAEDGSSVSVIVQGEGMDSGDKASNKAMAIAHKYALLQVFCIPTEEKKDPDYDTHEIADINQQIEQYIDDCGIPKGAENWKQFDDKKKSDLLKYFKKQTGDK